jgi:hypothetical protein
MLSEEVAKPLNVGANGLSMSGKATVVSFV